MIPYIILPFSESTMLGFSICRELVMQELKNKTLRIGKRVYRVVAEMSSLTSFDWELASYLW
ncbi:hypothetical protein [Escherichia coli]|uniref:hypothetical protein n=1 Tax=Escherichia coli TaxID=562 RepID=UPI00108055EC|nr:hypothetical protein E5S59_17660 [Escherichia coli]